MAEPRRIVVVGGGITGLATAWYLQSGRGAAGEAPAVTLLESGPRLGGKIRTDQFLGVPVEAGPDTFLGRVPWASDLCRAVGLGDDLIPPATTRAYVWTGERLRALPRQQVFGAPTGWNALWKSGILSPSGAARASLDLVLPRRRRSTDPSVAEVIGERFGPEVLDRLVDPIIGGINAGSSDRLSLRSTARPLAMAAAQHRSLLLGLRRDRQVSPGDTSRPLFLSVTGGLERLVEGVAAEIQGVDVRLKTPVEAIEAEGDGRWRVRTGSGGGGGGDDGNGAMVADAVVVATPAFSAAEVLAAAVPEAARLLTGIDYASVVVATLAYAPPATPSYLDGSGFLVARSEKQLMTACTWYTSKWPELRRCGHVLVRCSAGRSGDERAIAMDDGELVDQLHRELSVSIGVGEKPVASVVNRWPRSFPQYEVGHEARVDAIHRALGEAPGLFVAGAAYRGLGIAACIQQAEQAAGRILTYLGHRATGS